MKSLSYHSSYSNESLFLSKSLNSVWVLIGLFASPPWWVMFFGSSIRSDVTFSFTDDDVSWILWNEKITFEWRNERNNCSDTRPKKRSCSKWYSVSQMQFKCVILMAHMFIPKRILEKLKNILKGWPDDWRIEKFNFWEAWRQTNYWNSEINSFWKTFG